MVDERLKGSMKAMTLFAFMVFVVIVAAAVASTHAKPAAEPIPGPAPPDIDDRNISSENGTEVFDFPFFDLRDACYRQFEALKGPEACGKVRSLYWRECCILDTALETGNKSLCELQPGTSWKDYCRQQVDQTGGSYDLCSMAYPEQKDQCRFFEAMKTDNGTVCESIAEERMRGQCESGLTLRGKDATECEAISNLSQRRLCIMGAAKKEGNMSLCETVYRFKREANDSATADPQTAENDAYILYVPSGLNMSGEYPLVVALDPGANARGMIDKWKPLADRHKWIVMASKKFRNGADTTAIDAELVDAIRDDILPAYPADSSRIVATGFSGGGMGSHSLSVEFPEVFSAVIINTGMVNEYFLSPPMKAAYPTGKTAVFLASPTDFRYAEMKNDRLFLESRNWSTEWIEFDGGHTLAPDEKYEEAVQWLEGRFNGSSGSGTEAP